MAMRRATNAVAQVDAFVNAPGKLGSATLGIRSDTDRQRAEEAEQEVLAMRDWIDLDGYSDSEAARLGNAHNCHERAVLVRDELRHAGFAALILSHGLNEEHTTVVFDVGEGGLAAENLPSDMTKWHPDLHVADQLFGIPPTSAPKYPKALADDMERRTRNNEWVKVEGVEMSPNDPRFIDAVIRGPKSATEDGLLG